MSAGHLFKERFRKNRALFILIAVLSIASTVTLVAPFYGPGKAFVLGLFSTGSPPPEGVGDVGTAPSLDSRNEAESTTSADSEKGDLMAKGGDVATVARASPRADENESRAVALKLLDQGIPSRSSSKSAEDLRQTVQARPTDPDAWNQLGGVLLADGKTDAAIEAFDKAAHLPPAYMGRAYLFRDLARALEAGGRIEEAIPYMERSFHNFPLKGDGLYCIGFEETQMMRLYVKAKRYNQARQFFGTLKRSSGAESECDAIGRALRNLPG
jgi:tetratricopeptide (TPR) repeat protein